MATPVLEHCRYLSSSATRAVAGALARRWITSSPEVVAAAILQHTGSPRVGGVIILELPLSAATASGTTPPSPAGIVYLRLPNLVGACSSPPPVRFAANRFGPQHQHIFGFSLFRSDGMGDSAGGTDLLPSARGRVVLLPPGLCSPATLHGLFGHPFLALDLRFTYTAASGNSPADGPLLLPSPGGVRDLVLPPGPRFPAAEGGLLTTPGRVRVHLFPPGPSFEAALLGGDSFLAALAARFSSPTATTGSFASQGVILTAPGRVPALLLPQGPRLPIFGDDFFYLTSLDGARVPVRRLRSAASPLWFKPIDTASIYGIRHFRAIPSAPTAGSTKAARAYVYMPQAVYRGTSAGRKEDPIIRALRTELEVHRKMMIDQFQAHAKEMVDIIKEPKKKKHFIIRSFKKTAAFLWKLLPLLGSFGIFGPPPGC